MQAPVQRRFADFMTLLHSLRKPDLAYWDAVEEGTKQTPTVPESPWGS